jgi:hypothetical protein
MMSAEFLESSAGTLTMVLCDVIRPMRTLFVTFLPTESLHLRLCMFPSDVLLRTKLEGVLDLYELLGVFISSSVLRVVSIVLLSMLRKLDTGGWHHGHFT